MRCLLLPAAALLGVLGTAQASETSAPNQIVAVRAYALPSGKTEVRILLDRAPALPPTGFRLLSPDPMVVVDLPDTAPIPGERRVPLKDVGAVRDVELVPARDDVRVVVDLSAPASYRAFAEGDGVTIVVSPTAGASDPGG